MAKQTQLIIFLPFSVIVFCGTNTEQREINPSPNNSKKAYDNIDKSEAVFIDWFEDEETKDITWDLKTANAFDGFAEVYVVDKDFKWTYIKTHENMCGPYFMKRH